MAKAFILVGHSNWGKSATLKAMTGGKPHIHYHQIADKKFFIRRMSNDDFPEEFRDFCESLDPDTKEYLLTTLCPDFDNQFKYTANSLIILKEKYDLSFFVLKHKYGSDRCVTDQEMNSLEDYGPVYVYDKKSEAKDRAEAFKAYIQDNINIHP